MSHVEGLMLHVEGLMSGGLIYVEKSTSGSESLVCIRGLASGGLMARPEGSMSTLVPVL